MSYVGFVVDAQFSPANASQDGESVNCGKRVHADVDIHVALAPTPMGVKAHEPTASRNLKLCQTIAAEIIPHHRPDNWEPDSLMSLNDRPMRFHGQLFFDGSHDSRPCPASGPARGNPSARDRLGDSPRLQDRGVQTQRYDMSRTRTRIGRLSQLPSRA